MGNFGKNRTVRFCQKPNIDLNIRFDSYLRFFGQKCQFVKKMAFAIFVAKITEFDENLICCREFNFEQNDVDRFDLRSKLTILWSFFEKKSFFVIWSIYQPVPVRHDFCLSGFCLDFVSCLGFVRRPGRPGFLEKMLSVVSLSGFLEKSFPMSVCLDSVRCSPSGVVRGPFWIFAKMFENFLSRNEKEENPRHNQSLSNDQSGGRMSNS